MAEYTVFFNTSASCAVKVDSADIDGFDDLEPDEVREALRESAWDRVPAGLCAQCSGWGQDTGVDLGGDWEPDEDEYGVTDENGDPV